VLQIEHAVPSFEGWRKAFESDPIGRKKSGVLRYRIYRPVDNPNYVIIDLEFENVQQAGDALTALKKLWGVVEGKVMMNPQTRMLDVVETVDIK
jgi:hypothetical protein